MQVREKSQFNKYEKTLAGVYYYSKWKDFKKNNRGRRLDHIWVTNHQSLESLNAKIMIETRSLPQPSDHVPISYEFNLG